MKKELQRTTRKRNLNLIVFQFIKRDIRPSKICKALEIKPSTLQYYLTSLKRNGFIKKVGYGVWKVIKEYDLKEVQKSTQVASDTIGKNLNLFKEDYVRGHAFMFTLKIPKIYGWDNREKIFKRRKIDYLPLKNLGGGQKITFRGRNVHLKNNSVIVYEKSSYIAHFASKVRQHAIYNYLRLIRGLERYLGANFSFNGQYQFKVSRQHYALVKNVLAKQYDEEGKKLAVYNSQGLWFIIDNSFNLHEAETVHPKTAVRDNEIVQNFFNHLKKSPLTTTEIQKNFAEINLLLRQSSRSQIDTSMVLQQLDSNIRQIAKNLARRENA